MDANNKYFGHSILMKHSELDLFENVLDKLEEQNASSQNMGDWTKPSPSARQGEEKTTNAETST